MKSKMWWVKYGLPFPITGLGLFFIKKYFCNIQSSDILLIATALIIYFYTVATFGQLKQLRLSHNLQTLTNLMPYYNQLRDIRAKVFRKRGESVEFKDCTELSNLLDELGHITYSLPNETQKIAIEQWMETYIRCWIRLKDFVQRKRDYSIGRDYIFFEWLASKSLEILKSMYPYCHIKFYDYEEKGFVTKERYRYQNCYQTVLIAVNDQGVEKNVDFRRSKEIEKEIKKGSKGIPAPGDIPSGLVSLGP